MKKAHPARAALLTILLAGLLTPQPGNAQALFPSENGQALAGVVAFNAAFLATAWLNVESDQERFESNAQSAWVLGLRRDGVVVDEGSLNYLFCYAEVAQVSGIVAYSWDVKFWQWRSNGVHALLWQTGGIATMGRNLFTPDEVAKDCGDGFAKEWLKWNPRRTP